MKPPRRLLALAAVLAILGAAPALAAADCPRADGFTVLDTEAPAPRVEPERKVRVGRCAEGGVCVSIRF